MRLEIINRDATSNRYLACDEQGVDYINAEQAGAPLRHFTFDKIDCVLVSPQGRLSFQVGSEVFSVMVSPQNAMHLQLIESLVHSVYAARGHRGIVNGLR